MFCDFDVLALLSVKILLFWDVTPCSLLFECYTTQHLIPKDHFSDFRQRIGRILQKAGVFLSPKLIMIPGKSVFMSLPVSNVSHNSEKKTFFSFPRYDKPNSYVKGLQTINKLGSHYPSKILFAEDSVFFF